MDDTQPKEEAAHRSTERGDERRQSLVLAAYQIIAKKGFEGLRVREVAARIGVNIATLHYYFNSKEDLIRGVVEYLLHQFITVEAPLPAEGVQNALQKLHQSFADLQYQLQVAPEMFVVLTELHLRSQRDPAIQSMLTALNDGWQMHIEEIYREGLQQQLFRPDVDPHRAASWLIALIKGLSLQVVSNLEHFDFNLIATEFIAGFLNPPTKGEL
ncbi:MAG: TetR/AcrR family transcriptional regulator [Chloroflexota bacterium]